MQGELDIFLDAFPRIFRALHRRHVYDPSARRLLTSHQASVLDHLDPAIPTSLRDLARHLDVTPSTMSLTIDRLERAAFVRRARSAADARRTDLFLTPAGHRIQRRQKVLDPALARQVLASLSSSDRKAALAGLLLLAHAAETIRRRAQPFPRTAKTFRKDRHDR
ncbi:MAG TPA: MarR family winged helix-turn-helix transcriptional regulator [Phycisphaerae bacterium]|nr:MarR family winged helix-turn-helix transcriptional regulator [Phycisphaerae bacterium]